MQNTPPPFAPTDVADEIGPRRGVAWNLATAGLVFFVARSLALEWSNWMVVNHPINGGIPVDELALTWELLPLMLISDSNAPVLDLLPLFALSFPLGLALWRGRWFWLVGTPAVFAYFFWAALCGLVVQ